MNEQLTKFIELCLADGVISDKEREVIFRKAKAIGVDEDECEILIDSYTQQVNKIPDNNKSVTSKPKRNFTPKTVEMIKPADLNKEKKLLEEVTKLKEEEEEISANYDLVLDDLKVKTKKVNKTKTEIEVDFKKYKASYNKYRKKNITEYFNHVDKLISEKYGKTAIICSAKKKEELSCSNLKKINDFILKDAKWSLERYEKKATKLTVAFILLLIISIISFLVLAYGDFSDEYIKLLGVFILLSIVAYHGAKYFNNKNTLNFTEDNVKEVLKVVNKKFDKSFKTLAEQKEIINTYEKLSKHNLGIPQKDKVSN
ncbi:hypothetical protein [Mesoflavibacter zeaxanthinifaciens]|uniref:hypothetical protein n=1 Tax=Mesoflavibacter zeaxanthinifaciens TaxID=393060 RepID=UPI0026F2A92F|nr:hypothetical protein [Mesoflavibacter zeaxanthinifaciens]